MSQLTVSEAALLAGLIPAPSDYEPRGHPDKAEQRRQDVLKKMLEQHYITQAAVRPGSGPAGLERGGGQAAGAGHPHLPTGAAGTEVPVLRRLRREVPQRLKYGDDAVFGGGLTIQTTLDPDLQDEAEKAVANQLKGTKDPLEMALAVGRAADRLRQGAGRWPRLLQRPVRPR